MSDAEIATAATGWTLYDKYLGVLLLTYGGVLFKQHVIDRNSQGSNSKPSDDDDGAATEKAVASPTLFKRFQREFLIVFLTMMAADWMQGPYVYALYQHYGFSRTDNGILFIAGFGSSLVFGTWAGPIADSRGRKFACLLYGITYTLSCMTKHFPNFSILMVGRLLGGISTSILWSSFESWMVSEHNSRGFAPGQLNGTFSQMTAFNGIVAIASGFVAQWAVDFFGHPVAPFDVSAVCLVIGSAFIHFSWSENFGVQSKSVVSQMSDAAHSVMQSPVIFLVGLQQALFEGAMYTFVFMWTPALAKDETTKIPHGLIFACFMIACSLGGTLFGLVASMPAYRLLFFVYAGAAMCMCVPMVTEEPGPIMGAFIGFELLVGLFWPAIGTLRSEQVPEHCRATVINLFRMPLNLIVCGVLYFQGSMDIGSVFKFCAAFHCLALVTSVVLARILAQQPGK